MPIDDVAARGFQAGAAAYETARPGYPDEALATPRRASSASRPAPRSATWRPAPASSRAASSTSAPRVSAVEPVEGDARRRPSATVPDAEVVDGTAEAIPLPDASVDVVTVAQAFHWFDARAALAEIARVLTPGGGLALLWNERDERTAWVAEMSRLIRWHERTVSRYQHVDWAEVVAASRRFTPLEERAVHWDQPMTREVLADRVRSISYIAVMPTAERERLAAEVTALVAPAARAVRPPVPVPGPVVPPALTARPPCRRPRRGGQDQRRDLPWRRTRDPWEVLVCEVMAQQTQVARVAERWRPVPRAVPHAGRARRRARRPRSSGGGPASATTAGPATSTAAPRRSWSAHDGRAAGDLDGAARPPRHRSLHRPGRARLRLRARPRRRRHQHRAGAGPLGRSAPPAGRGAAGRRRGGAARPGVGVEPGDARPRAPACAAAATRAATSARSPSSCAWARAGRPAPDPADGSAGVSGQAVALRGQRPPGPRPAGGGAASRATSPLADLAAVMGWPDDPRRAERVSRPRSSPTGSCRSSAGAYRLATRSAVTKSTISWLTSAGFSTWRKWPAPSTISRREPARGEERGRRLGELDAHAAVGAPCRYSVGCARDVAPRRSARRRGRGRRPTPPRVAR